MQYLIVKKPYHRFDIPQPENSLLRSGVQGLLQDAWASERRQQGGGPAALVIRGGGGADIFMAFQVPRLFFQFRIGSECSHYVVGHRRFYGISGPKIVPEIPQLHLQVVRMRGSCCPCGNQKRPGEVHSKHRCFKQRFKAAVRVSLCFTAAVVSMLRLVMVVDSSSYDAGANGWGLL